MVASQLGISRVVVIQSAVVAVVLLKVARVRQRLIEDRLHLLDKVQAAAVLIAGVEGRRVGEGRQQLGAVLLLVSLVMADDFAVLLLLLLKPEEEEAEEVEEDLLYSRLVSMIGLSLAVMPVTKFGCDCSRVTVMFVGRLKKPEKFETFSFEFSDFWFVSPAMRMLVLRPLQPQRSCQPVSARLSRVAVAAATAALGCRESTVMRGSSAQHSAARSDVTWAMCNVRRLGPCALPKVSRWPRHKCGEVWLHLGDCQRPSPRALRAERARSEAAGVGGRPSEARVSRRSSYRICLAVHEKSGEVWLHLTYQERPPTRVSRAERARPEAAGVLGKSSEARVSRCKID
ncbi:hypothetical protein TYRP_023411 [Tyrophagus putrescentiae]|nr:hypothetical protein TYRP_023411 [Tyrophagus putrescentiae]